MSYFEDACESIDASVFSGDMLFDDERRKMLKDYIGRWARAIEAHESAPPVADDQAPDDDDDWSGDDMLGASG